MPNATKKKKKAMVNIALKTLILRLLGMEMLAQVAVDFFPHDNQVEKPTFLSQASLLRRPT